MLELFTGLYVWVRARLWLPVPFNYFEASDGSYDLA